MAHHAGRQRVLRLPGEFFELPHQRVPLGVVLGFAWGDIRGQAGERMQAASGTDAGAGEGAVCVMCRVGGQQAGRGWCGAAETDV